MEGATTKCLNPCVCFLSSPLVHEFLKKRNVNILGGIRANPKVYANRLLFLFPLFF